MDNVFAVFESRQRVFDLGDQPFFFLREVLEKMRSYGETPGAILVLRVAESEPEVSIFEVALSKEAV